MRTDADRYSLFPSSDSFVGHRGVHLMPPFLARPLGCRGAGVGRPLGGAAGLSAASKCSHSLWDLPDYRRTAPAVVRCILQFQVMVTEGTVTYRTEQAHSTYLMLLLAIAAFKRLRRSRTRNETKRNEAGGSYSKVPNKRRGVGSAGG